MGLVEERISFRIAKPLLDVINEISKKTGATRSEIIRLAIEYYLQHVQNFEEELKARYEKEQKIREIIQEGKKITHEVFYKARYERLITKAIKDKLDVEQIVRIAEQYYKEAQVIGQLTAWHNVNSQAMISMEGYGYDRSDILIFREAVRRLIDED
jgi:metal-responsive CopG/Arc/MetJ family transcriptional regulator